jgi:hypothetical protein
VLNQGEMIQKRLLELNEPQRISHQQHHHHYIPRARSTASESCFYEKYSDNEVFSDFEIVRCDELSSLPSCSKWNNAASSVMTDTDDELFLVIENHNDNDSGVFITKEQRSFYDMEVDIGSRINCISTPKRKFRNTRDFESLRDHAINEIHSTENFARTSCKFEIIRKELRSEIDNVKEIIDQEHSFLTKIGSLDERKFIQDNYSGEFCDNNETVIL